ncbi:hypothetical protein [Chakrabartyella piscis]|uniref:hypothetical protein n=1 Tax=Chakrabartyella piscis TaxID=2918914 RepID=UPI0029585257|nr:hypothetical protein [Chakrabartyella piscis]
MGMPQIPDGKNRPTFEETIVDLLESIALEEMAMAHIMNAEGEKLQEVVKKYGCREICHLQLESGCRNTEDMLQTLIMKEWLLLSKMKSVITLQKETTDTSIPYGCRQMCQNKCQMRENQSIQ